MQYIAWKGRSLSRLMLGTVQFGVDYGIANRGGQPELSVVRAILECAFEGGVNCLDTAAAYGTSEEVLGQLLAELGMAGQVLVVTKVRTLPDDLSSSEADAAVEASVQESLRRLRLETLPVCLFHNEGNARYMDSLARLQDKGLVEHIGVSTTTLPCAQQSVASDDVGAMQIQGSLLDSRFLNRIPARAKAAGIAVFVRSVYLQGLLLMPEADILPQLSEVVPIRRRLEEVAKAAGLSLAELAVRAILSREGVTCALVGVDSVEQMRENLAVFNAGPLDSGLMEAVEIVVPTLPDEVLNPWQWPPRVPAVA